MSASEEKYPHPAEEVPVRSVHAAAVAATAAHVINSDAKRFVPPLLARALKRVAEKQAELQQAEPPIVESNEAQAAHPPNKKSRVTPDIPLGGSEGARAPLLPLRHRALQVEAVVSRFMDKLPEWRTTKLIEEAAMLGLTQLYLYADEKLAHKALLRSEVVPILQARVNDRFGADILRVFWDEVDVSPWGLPGNARPPPAEFGSIRLDWSSGAASGAAASGPAASGAAAPPAATSLTAACGAAAPLAPLAPLLLRHRWTAVTRDMIDEWLATVPTIEALARAEAEKQRDTYIDAQLADDRIVNNERVHANMAKSSGVRVGAFLTTINVGPDPARQAAAIAELAEAHYILDALERAYTQATKTKHAEQGVAPSSERAIDLGARVACHVASLRALEKRIRLTLVMRRHPLAGSSCGQLMSDDTRGIVYWEGPAVPGKGPAVPHAPCR